jgi:hypothetical protein
MQVINSFFDYQNRELNRGFVMKFGFAMPTPTQAKLHAKTHFK